MKSRHLLLNVNLNSPMKPRRRPCLPNVEPQSLPLNQHPKWGEFLQLVDSIILDEHQHLRPHFLALLEREGPASSVKPPILKGHS